MQEVAEALRLWDMADAQVQPVAHRENNIFRLRYGGSDFALRLHRKGLHSYAEIQSELLWLEELARRGMEVPRPIASASGELMRKAGGFQADVLSWIGGQHLGSAGADLGERDRAALFSEIGRQIASMHEICDAWDVPAGFTRCSWDCAGLLGERLVWGPFWNCPFLDANQQELFSIFREQAAADLNSVAHELDYGLIHADLVRENVLVDGSQVRFIDFDDGGYGFRLFELATVLVKHLDDPAYASLRRSLLEGYCEIRKPMTAQLGLFMALRAATYVGWVAPRMGESYARKHCGRFVKTAETLVQQYLEDGQLLQAGP